MHHPLGAWIVLVAVVACRSAAPVFQPPVEPSGIAALGIPGAFHGKCNSDSETCPSSYFQSFVGEEVAGHNVGAFIRGSDPDRYREVVVVGAHYDHLGTSPRFALDPDLLASTRPGADDNASGTAAVLELARRLAAAPPSRSVLLVHFDAEEWGLVGSRALADSVAHALGVRAARSSVSADRSDHASFALIGAPALSLTSGFHADYHRVTDVAARIDVPGVVRIVDVAEGIVRAAGRRTWPPRQSSLTTTR